MRADWVTNWKGFKNTTINRPWGMFHLLTENVKCTVKELLIHRGQMLSLQFHVKRDQVYIIKEDNKTLSTEVEKFAFEVWYSDKKFPMHLIDNQAKIEKWLEKHLRHEYINSIGAVYAFERGIVHRIKYKGPKIFGSILDLAFGENDEEDIIRLQDKYGREKK